MQSSNVKNRKQAWNPYLPLDTYVPDGEPHVFGDRVYLYGSHDEEGGSVFCALDYEVFSAPVTDLADWRSEGVSYRAVQDPDFGETYQRMYAPDVVCGNDGRYYLYYAMAGRSFTGPIHAAVSVSPAGPFSYYGYVRNPDGTPYTRHVTFDPGVINDNGTIRLYYGWSLAAEPEKLAHKSDDFPVQVHQAEKMLFGKTEEELQNTPEGVMGANVVELDEDMLTVTGKAKRIVPGQLDAQGTSFEGHAFFEASSIRKIGDVYYFIYSSEWQHELCYAVSHFPDRDFVFGGVIISNGDIGYEGRKASERLAMTGNNHGSIECINGNWYVFYHRHTHKTTYSRQGCAEKIRILPDGRIPQVEMTSCGLNPGPLKTEGCYPATIACNLTNGQMPHIGPKGTSALVPYITDQSGEQFIADITDGTRIGYKYFLFDGKKILLLTVRGSGKGTFEGYAGKDKMGEIFFSGSAEWTQIPIKVEAWGEQVLYLRYRGSGKVDFKELHWNE